MGSFESSLEILTKVLAGKFEFLNLYDLITTVTEIQPGVSGSHGVHLSFNWIGFMLYISKIFLHFLKGPILIIHVGQLFGDIFHLSFVFFQIGTVAAIFTISLEYKWKSLDMDLFIYAVNFWPRSWAVLETALIFSQFTFPISDMNFFMMQ